MLGRSNRCVYSARRMNAPQKQQRLGQLLLQAAIIFGFLLLPKVALCAQADSTKVDLMLHELISDNMYLSYLEFETPKNVPLLGDMATGDTKRLDPGLREWNPNHPKWKLVYDRVYADIDKELAPSAAIAAYKKCAALNCYAQDIASELQPADVDAILSYLDTSEGKRFQAFQQQVDEIFVSGARAPSSPLLPNKLSAEQRKRFWRMLKLSIYVKSLEAGTNAYHLHDPSEGDLVEWMMAYAVVQKEDELEKLQLQYGNDLPAFEAFLGTNASQHLFAAMPKAIANASQRMRQIEAGVRGVENRHEEEWKALLRAESTQ